MTTSTTAAGNTPGRPAQPDTAAKDSPTGAASTLSSDVLHLLAAIRDALDVPSPRLGAPGGYAEMFRLTHRRAAAVRLAAQVAVQMGNPSWSYLTETIRGGIERHPVTYPIWQDDEDGGEQS